MGVFFLTFVLFVVAITENVQVYKEMNLFNWSQELSNCNLWAKLHSIWFNSLYGSFELYPFNKCRYLEKSGVIERKILFFQSKYMLQVLKRTVSVRQFFWATKNKHLNQQIYQYWQFIAQIVCLSIKCPFEKKHNYRSWRYRWHQ